MATRKAKRTPLRGPKRQALKPSASDKDFIKLAHKRFDQAQDAEHDQREREIEDLQFAAGEQWPEEIKVMRAGQDAGNGQPAIPAKPCLTINKVLEPINQLVGDAQDSELGFELVPADDFGELVGPIDDTEIKLREGLVRRIQRESEALDARVWAFDRGIKCGRGYWLVNTKYADGKTNDQDICVGRIANQNSVTLEPGHEQPDGSDAEWGFVRTQMAEDEYRETYPFALDGKKNRLAELSNDEFRALGDEYPDWFNDDKETRYYTVVDYYYTEREARTLCTLDSGEVAWKNELPEDAEYDEDLNRTVIEKTIKWAKIDGIQRLEETDWPSPYIPIVKYVGRELQPYDHKQRFEGIVRPAIDPGRGFNYMVSQWVWQIGLAPIPQIMMAGGQDEGWEQEYKLMTTRSIPVLHYNQTDYTGRPAPPPFKPPTNTEIGAIAGSIAMFDEAIQSTTESHNPSHGKSDPALRSGKAIDSVVANDKHGSSNYLSNWARSIAYEGKIINSLLYPIYGTRPGRITRILDGNNNQQSVMLGKHYTMQGTGKMARPMAVPEQTVKTGQLPPDAQKYELTKDAKFNCVVKVTKNFDTRRQEEAAILGQLISAEPEPMMAMFGDLWFKNQDGPGHDEMAERAKIMLDPKIQAALQAKSQGMDIPPPVQAQLTQLQQKTQEQDGIIKKAQQIIQTDQIKADNEIKKLQLKYDYDYKIERMKESGRIEAARITAAKQTPDLGAEAQEEQVATGIEHAQENFSAEADHQRELQKMALQHTLDTQQSAQEHAQTMQQGEQQASNQAALAEQSQGHALEQNQQQAALQPPPAEGSDNA